MPSVRLATHEWPSSRRDPASAPIAVLVHGVTGWHRTWWRVGPALAERGWRVVAVDQRGHGTSPRLDGAATIEDLADDLERTIDEVAGGTVDLLVGHSLGAAVSMCLAHRRPTIARRVVLEDPPSLDRSDDDDFLERLAREAAAARETPDAEVARELAENPRWTEGDARQNVEGRALVDVDGIVASLRKPRDFQVVELAARMAVPVLYILADDERSVLVGPARARLLENLPPDARMIELDAGHTVHRDRFEEYVSAVVDWAGRDG